MIYSTYTIFSANRPISIIFGQNHARVIFLTVDFKTVHFRTKLSKFTISQENHPKILIWVTYRILNN